MKNTYCQWKLFIFRTVPITFQPVHDRDPPKNEAFVSAIRFLRSSKVSLAGFHRFLATFDLSLAGGFFIGSARIAACAFV